MVFEFVLQGMRPDGFKRPAAQRSVFDQANDGLNGGELPSKSPKQAAAIAVNQSKSVMEGCAASYCNTLTLPVTCRCYAIVACLPANHALRTNGR